MQRRGGLREHSCCFGCELASSTEHYTHCPHVARVASMQLRLPRPHTLQTRMADFLLFRHPLNHTDGRPLARQALRPSSICNTRSWRLSPRGHPEATPRPPRGHPEGDEQLPAAEPRGVHPGAWCGHPAHPHPLAARRPLTSPPPPAFSPSSPLLPSSPGLLPLSLLLQATTTNIAVLPKDVCLALRAFPTLGPPARVHTSLTSTTFSSIVRNLRKTESAIAIL